jgi:hypothetical protein
LNTHQSALLIKQDKILRSQIVPKIKDLINLDSVPSDKISKALGFDIEDVDKNLQLEVVDTPEYFEMLQNTKQRDGVLDSLLTEAAKLRSAKDMVMYEMMLIKIKHGMIKKEDLNDQEKYIYEAQELAAKERAEDKVQENKRRQEALKETGSKEIDQEFLKYAGAILF